MDDTRKKLPVDVEYPLEESMARPLEGFTAKRCAVPESLKEEAEEKPDTRTKT